MTPRAFLALPFAVLCPCPGAGHRQLQTYLGTDFKDAEMQGSFVNTSGETDEPEPESAIAGTPWAPFLDAGKFMGEGAFGQAFMYELKAPCKGSVVVKQLKRGAGVTKLLLAEIKTLMDLRGHANVLQLYDYYPKWDSDWFRPDPPQLMTEVAYGGELDKAFFEETGGWFGPNGRIHAYLSSSAKDQRREIKKKIVLMMMRDMLSGLEFLHGKGYVHRDIKPANMWSANEDASCVGPMTCRYLVGDLGLAAKVDGSRRGFAGTPTFMPPETLNQVVTVFRSDVYSLGLSIAVLMAFPEEYKPETMAELGEATRKIIEIAASKEYYPEGLRRLVSDMVLRDFSQRPTASEALQRVRDVIKSEFPDAPAQQQDSKEPPCVAACREKKQKECEPNALA